MIEWLIKTNLTKIVYLKPTKKPNSFQNNGAKLIIKMDSFC